MRNRIITTSLLGSAIIFGITSGIFDTFLMFLLVGSLPGTQYMLSPLQMGGLVSIATGLVVILLTGKRGEAALRQQYATLRAYLPKRRFSRL